MAPTSTGDGAQKTFTTVRVEDPNLAAQLDQQKVHYSGEVQNEWVTELIELDLPASC